MTATASTRQHASELRVGRCIDGAGRDRVPLTVKEMGSGIKIVHCFQHWCPGCHSAGFPILKRLVSALEPIGVSFAVVQTVFEGFEENTFERLRENQQHYDLALSFGHDQVVGNRPTVMQEYHTGGTPWFIVMLPSNEIAFSDFRVDPEHLVQALGA